MTSQYLSRLTIKFNDNLLNYTKVYSKATALT